MDGQRPQVLYGGGAAGCDRIYPELRCTHLCGLASRSGVALGLRLQVDAGAVIVVEPLESRLSEGTGCVAATFSQRESVLPGALAVQKKSPRCESPQAGASKVLDSAS
ncbi:hypothetical protein [Caballeronia sp. J97]|uniref:hypothetical protein n=1 Tax=Caballeronia sp. J97 TaxID=2805429 RepID=UPI002AB2ECF8|nr:hypothetical protein [Caballeronia sp. J97]